MTTQVAQQKSTEHAVFSTQEILEAAQINITGFILAAARDCRDRGLSFDEWVGITGRLFAQTWDQSPDKSPLSVARRAALNFVSAGARDVAVTGNDSRAEVTYRWPADGWLASFGITPQEVQTFSRIFAPIAEHLGLQFAYAPEGDRTRLTFAR